MTPQPLAPSGRGARASSTLESQAGSQTASTDVDARVAHLQHALNSRIVVEQATGMLNERHALTPAEAYELIRLAARSNGLKVHALSNSVLA